MEATPGRDNLDMDDLPESSDTSSDSAAAQLSGYLDTEPLLEVADSLEAQQQAAPSIASTAGLPAPVSTAPLMPGGTPLEVPLVGTVDPATSAQVLVLAQGKGVQKVLSVSDCKQTLCVPSAFARRYLPSVPVDVPVKVTLVDASETGEVFTVTYLYRSQAFSHIFSTGWPLICRKFCLQPGDLFELTPPNREGHIPIRFSAGPVREVLTAAKEGRSTRSKNTPHQRSSNMLGHSPISASEAEPAAPLHNGTGPAAVKRLTHQDCASSLVLPVSYARSQLPDAEEDQDLVVADVANNDHQWTVTYSMKGAPNFYLLVRGWPDVVQDLQILAGDFIALYPLDSNGHVPMAFIRSSSDAPREGVAASSKSAQASHNTIVTNGNHVEGGGEVVKQLTASDCRVYLIMPSVYSRTYLHPPGELEARLLEVVDVDNPTQTWTVRSVHKRVANFYCLTKGWLSLAREQRLIPGDYITIFPLDSQGRIPMRLAGTGREDAVAGEPEAGANKSSAADSTRRRWGSALPKLQSAIFDIADRLPESAVRNPAASVWIAFARRIRTAKRPSAVTRAAAWLQSQIVDDVLNTVWLAERMEWTVQCRACRTVRDAKDLVAKLEDAINWELIQPGPESESEPRTAQANSKKLSRLRRLGIQKGIGPSNKRAHATQLRNLPPLTGTSALPPDVTLLFQTQLLAADLTPGCTAIELPREDVLQHIMPALTNPTTDGDLVSYSLCLVDSVSSADIEFQLTGIADLHSDMPYSLGKGWQQFNATHDLQPGDFLQFCRTPAGHLMLATHRQPQEQTTTASAPARAPPVVEATSLDASNYRGIESKVAGRWRAVIRHRGAYVKVGIFTTAEAAAQAYDKLAIHMCGAGVPLNFPAANYEAEWNSLLCMPFNELLEALRQDSVAPSMAGVKRPPPSSQPAEGTKRRRGCAGGSLDTTADEHYTDKEERLRPVYEEELARPCHHCWEDNVEASCSPEDCGFTYIKDRFLSAAARSAVDGHSTNAHSLDVHASPNDDDDLGYPSHTVIAFDRQCGCSPEIQDLVPGGYSDECAGQRYARMSSIPFPVRVFSSSDGRTHGVRAMTHIPKGSMVIIQSEACEREKAYLAEGRQNFLLELSESQASGRQFTVDATHVGNIARIVRSSSDGGNLKTYEVCSAGGLPHLMSFAREDIAPGEELISDYHLVGSEGRGSDRGDGSGSPVCTRTAHKHLLAPL
eukprot:jgi/Chlat1/4976/Chrsp32S04928